MKNTNIKERDVGKSEDTLYEKKTFIRRKI